jgi:hypothetical protein
MAKVIVKATDKGWEIHKDDVLLRLYGSRRAALAGLAKLRAELKAGGERSLIKFEAQVGRPRSN